MGRLDNKIAIVTGGAQGQGEEIVRQFVAEGAKVVIADVAKEQNKSLEEHYAHLLVHGTLHAQGWDHEKKREAEAMAARLGG